MEAIHGSPMPVLGGILIERCLLRQILVAGVVLVIFDRRLPIAKITRLSIRVRGWVADNVPRVVLSAEEATGLNPSALGPMLVHQPGVPPFVMIATAEVATVVEAFARMLPRVVGGESSDSSRIFVLRIGERDQPVPLKQRVIVGREQLDYDPVSVAVCLNLDARDEHRIEPESLDQFLLEEAPASHQSFSQLKFG
jgi:hypothetical protein